MAYSLEEPPMLPPPALLMAVPCALLVGIDCVGSRHLLCRGNGLDVKTDGRKALQVGQ